MDDRKHGAGLCITVDGKYFEGMFVDNELNGNGVAIFNQGNYYEGDLTIVGPHGRGSLYLPISTIKRDNALDELDERKLQMSGNILTGNLNGNWDDVKINNGSITFNQDMPKYSK